MKKVKSAPIVIDQGKGTSVPVLISYFRSMISDQKLELHYIVKLVMLNIRYISCLTAVWLAQLDGYHSRVRVLAGPILRV